MSRFHGAAEESASVVHTLDDEIRPQDTHGRDTDAGLCGAVGGAEASEDDGAGATHRSEERLFDMLSAIVSCTISPLARLLSGGISARYVNVVVYGREAFVDRHVATLRLRGDRGALRGHLRHTRDLDTAWSAYILFIELLRTIHIAAMWKTCVFAAAKGSLLGATHQRSEGILTACGVLLLLCVG